MKYKLLDIKSAEEFALKLTIMTQEGWSVYGNHSQYLDKKGKVRYTVLLSAPMNTNG